MSLIAVNYLLIGALCFSRPINTVAFGNVVEEQMLVICNINSLEQRSSTFLLSSSPTELEFILSSLQQMSSVGTIFLFFVG